MKANNVRYAGFWHRLGAHFIDVLILLPLVIPIVWGQRHYRLALAYAFLPQVLIGLFFSVYLVARFGGTPGKLLLGLRIAKVSGEKVDFRAAFLRNLPAFGLDTLWRIGLVMALLKMSDAQYFALNPKQVYAGIMGFAAPWCQWTSTAMTVWTWSEFAVLLTNTKRRALHDFIAGTVVVKGRLRELVPPVTEPTLAAPSPPR